MVPHPLPWRSFAHGHGREAFFSRPDKREGYALNVTSLRRVTWRFERLHGRFCVLGPSSVGFNPSFLPGLLDASHSTAH